MLPANWSALSSAYIIHATWSCFTLVWHEARWAEALARPNTGNNMLASIAMMAMTTSSSMSVKPPWLFALVHAAAKWWRIGGVGLVLFTSTKHIAADALTAFRMSTSA